MLEPVDLIYPGRTRGNTVIFTVVSCSVVSDSLQHGCTPPGSSVHGILQARILEWVAIPSPGELPDPGIEPGSPALQEDSLPSEPPEKPIRFTRAGK